MQQKRIKGKKGGGQGRAEGEGEGGIFPLSLCWPVWCCTIAGIFPRRGAVSSRE